MKGLLFDLAFVPPTPEGGPTAYIIVGAVIVAAALAVYFIVRSRMKRK